MKKRSYMARIGMLFLLGTSLVAAGCGSAQTSGSETTVSTEIESEEVTQVQAEEQSETSSTEPAETTVPETTEEPETTEAVVETAASAEELNLYSDSEELIVFSDAEVDQRIAEIRDYCWNKQDQLTIVQYSFWSYVSGDTVDMSFFFHGDDLLYAGALSEEPTYRLYFYKTQLIQMLVEENGQQQTYRQMYKDLEGVYYDPDILLYLYMQDMGRKMIDLTVQPVPMTDAENGLYQVTDYDSDTGMITAHHVYMSGGDGAMSYIGQNNYQFRITEDTFSVSYAEDPDNYSYISDPGQWLQENCDGTSGVILNLEIANDGETLMYMEAPYFP